MSFFLGLIFFFQFTQAADLSQKAEDFFSWLSRNEKYFADCKLEKKGDLIFLCDGTQVSHAELKKLFAKNISQITSELKQKKIQIEVICNSEKSNREFENISCLNESSNKTFKKVASLHGLYLPDENKIVIRNSATRGTLIHEYIHSLQTLNQVKIDEHIYKSEKNQLRKEIEKELDQLLSEVKKLEQEKKQEEVKQKVAQFMKLNDFMLAFSKWQDLIDERSLFLLYIKYEKDFNIEKADIELAKKNLKFICNRKDLVGVLSQAECSL